MLSIFIGKKKLFPYFISLRKIIALNECSLHINYDKYFSWNEVSQVSRQKNCDLDCFYRKIISHIIYDFAEEWKIAILVSCLDWRSFCIER